MPRRAPRNPKVPLRDAVESLARFYPVQGVLRDPLALIVWENIGYLIDDDRRSQLFSEFAERVGIGAQAIARAREDILHDIARRGGMRPETRVERLRSIGDLTLREAAGDLRANLQTLTLAKARTFLKKFPGIGDPGADKILLFSGTVPLPCVDSNGLRVLVRLGYCPQAASYGQTYKLAVSALGEQGVSEREWLISAYSALRAHGKALCKRSAPLCMACPLDPICGHVAAEGL